MCIRDRYISAVMPIQKNNINDLKFPRESETIENNKHTKLLEKTNESYAVAKIAGLKMYEAYNQQYGVNYICLI